MKKLVLLASLLLLTGCGATQNSNTSSLNTNVAYIYHDDKINDDGYVYHFEIDLLKGGKFSN